MDRIELCACTSDRERSTRAGEARTSDGQPVNGNPDSDSYSCQCERSLTLACRQTQTVRFPAFYSRP